MPENGRRSYSGLFFSVSHQAEIQRECSSVGRAFDF